MRQQTIIGFIFVPDEVAVSRRAWVLPMREQATTQTWSGDSMPYPKPTISTMAIHVKFDDYGSELFIDEEDFGIDVWRRVSGFLEVVRKPVQQRVYKTAPKTEDKPQPTVRKRKRLELDL